MESRGYGEGTRELLEGRRGGLVRSGLRQSPGVGASRSLSACLAREDGMGWLSSRCFRGVLLGPYILLGYDFS